MLRFTVNRRRLRVLFVLVLSVVILAVVAREMHARRAMLERQYVSRVWTALNGIERQGSVMLAMRDGVRLATDVYLPRHRPPPYPTVYVQTVYGRNKMFGPLEAVQLFGPEGYAVVAQDVRGRFDSGGEFEVYRSVPRDGVDTLDWIAEQPWSNGRIGTFGCSALGEVQYILAAERHPNHTAMIVQAGGGAMGAYAERHGYFGLYEGGVFNLAAGVGWFANYGAKDRYHEERGAITPALLASRPLETLVARSGSEPTWFESMVSHPPGDRWWHDQPYINSLPALRTAGLHVNEWFDLGTHHSLAMAFPFDVDHAAPQRAIVAPAAHCGATRVRPVDRLGELDVRGGQFDYHAEYLRFFGRHLKQTDAAPGAPATVFVLNANAWRTFSAWPPASAQQRAYFLASGAGANTAAGDGALIGSPVTAGRDRFVYDPLNPVLSKGGPICCTGNPADVPGSFDQSVSAARDDVLVYDSPVLTDDVLAVGPVSAVLYVQTSAPDTDFTAKLVDVRPDGRAMNVQDGAFRLRYRNGFATPALAAPDEVYQIEVSLRDTAYLFKAGSRIRLEISSSNFPRLAPNFNSGGPAHLETQAAVATNTVHHGQKRPSALRLTVLPDGL